MSTVHLAFKEMDEGLTNDKAGSEMLVERLEMLMSWNVSTNQEAPGWVKDKVAMQHFRVKVKNQI